MPSIFQVGDYKVNVVDQLHVRIIVAELLSYIRRDMEQFILSHLRFVEHGCIGECLADLPVYWAYYDPYSFADIHSS